jgi:hypothetical protein
MSERTPMKKILVAFGLALLVSATAVHLWYLVLELRNIERVAPFLAQTFLAWLQCFLIFSFLVAGTGLMIRTRAGLWCSLVGTVGILLCHLAWFNYSKKTLRSLMSDPFFLSHPELLPPNSFGLIGARWWDFVFLLMFVALLIWEIKTLVQQVGTSDRSAAQQEP